MSSQSRTEINSAKVKRKFPDYRFSWEIFTELIVENIYPKPYWLDLGAGSNIWIREQPGADFAVGVDIEKPATLEIGPNETYCLADGEALPFRDESFDLVTTRYVIEHLERPRQVLGEIVRVLKPSGTLLIQTTNKMNPLVLAARLIPFGIKKRLFGALFGEIPSGIYKTYYYYNRPAMFDEVIGNLRREKLIMAEEVLCSNTILFGVSLSLLRIIEATKLYGFKSNIIAIYRKSAP